MTTTRECYKGWILSPSPTDGENVPFFIYVRDKDIKWDENNLPEELKNLSLQGENREVVFVNSCWKFNLNGWRIRLYMDGSYKAQKRVCITDAFNNINTSSSEISADINLPFSTVNDDEFNAQITIESDDNAIKYSTTSINQINTSADELNDITVNLCNNVNTYSANFVLNNTYSKSCIHITVEGNVPKY